MFAEPGWSSYAQKEYLVWRQIVHLVTKGWSVISTESLPRLVFTELSSVTKPRGCNDSGKVLFLDAQRQTARQRSRTTALARVHRLHRPSYTLPSDGAHFAHLHSVSSTWRNFFRGSVTTSNKKKLSQFLLKKTVLVL